MQVIWRAGKKCYLPVIDQQVLQFALYEVNDALVGNQHQILEPVSRANVIDAGKLDLVMLPMIAFDNEGHRLGTVGGYYDRTFAFLRSRENSKPFMLGLAFDCQQAEQLPVDEWDVRLDGVLTESGIIEF
jgi:5-formyltetrahydrofolate cyclo-ligase